MRKRFYFTAVGLALAATLFFMIPLCVSDSVAKTYDFTYSTFFPSTHIQTKVPEAWAAEIEKLSKG